VGVPPRLGACDRLKVLGHLMQEGGNDKLNEFLQGRGVARNTPIPRKYNSPEAELYKERYVEGWRRRTSMLE
jgi:hypothetical protein